jgi:hypothetical protein
MTGAPRANNNARVISVLATARSVKRKKKQEQEQKKSHNDGRTGKKKKMKCTHKLPKKQTNKHLNKQPKQQTLQWQLMVGSLARDVNIGEAE